MTEHEQKKPPKTQPTEDRGRTIAEWTVTVISIAVLLFFVGFIVYDYRIHANDPPRLEVQPQLQAIQQKENRYTLPVKVTNSGSLIAQDAWIGLTCQAGNRSETVEFLIDFLPGDDSEEVEIALSSNPRACRFTYVASYKNPEQ